MNVMGSTEYMIICYVSAVLCILSFVITLIIFLKLNIIEVIGDISGSTARKEIESIRNENIKTGNKAHKISYINKERGRLTDRITPSGKLNPNEELVELSVGTEKISTGKLENESGANDTNCDETMLLNNNRVDDETTVLTNGFNEETTILSSNIAENGFNLQTQYTNDDIVIEDEIIFVHSDEHID